MLDDSQGGNFYVCGDSRGLAPGVHEALVQIAMDQGGLPRDAALQYWKDMQKDRRYQMDVF